MSDLEWFLIIFIGTLVFGVIAAYVVMEYRLASLTQKIQRYELDSTLRRRP